MTSNPRISISPHIHSGKTTQSIMLDVLIALAPTAIAGTVIFGLRSLAVIATCLVCCILFESLFNIAVKKEQTVGDLSAAVTGLLLALNLPANIPLWQAAVGSFFAIVIVKCLFGGIGCNFVNPAITARVFMLVSFGAMTVQSFPKKTMDAISSATSDTVSMSTPLPSLQSGYEPDLLDLFLGQKGGAIGEVCILALLLGGIYLIARRVITWHMPVCYISAVFALTFLLGGFDARFALASVLSGGLFLGAIFMATDYVTSPSTAWGKVVFALGAALITVLIRFYGTYPEGVSFAILFMNIITPYIDSFTARKIFGGGKA